MFVASGCDRWWGIRVLEEGIRKFIRGDLREDGCASRTLCLVNDVFSHYANKKPRSSGTDAKREIPFGDVMIPERMIGWNVNMGSLPVSLAPYRDMGNVFTKAMAAAAKKGPPFSPFAAPQLRKAPWAVPLQSNERAAKV